MTPIRYFMRGIAAAILFASGPVYAAPTALVADAAKSQITFAAKQMGTPAEGKFGKFTANISWDAAKPDASHAELTIDMSSFDIGLAEVNQEAMGKEWFDAKSFPQAKFVSSSVKSLGGGKFETTGKLTIKGHTNDVTAPFTVKTEGANQVFDGAFSIKRLQYNVGEGSWKDTSTVADDVQIKFKIVAGPAPVAKK